MSTAAEYGLGAGAGAGAGAAETGSAAARAAARVAAAEAEAARAAAAAAGAGGAGMGAGEAGAAEAGAAEAGAAAEVAAAEAGAAAEVAAAAYAAMPDVELLEAWDREVDFGKRTLIVQALIARNLFPAGYTKGWETSTGAYPSHEDPEFLQKLLAKREFAESLQRTWKPTGDPCAAGGDFEVTSVQRFVANLMSPRSPYMSALLFHGVGVGKTCAGVQIMEAWLNAYPREKVFLVAPPTIQGGFYKTLFDMKRLTIPEEEGAPNSATGCTGSTYLELTGTLLERKPEVIERRVAQAIRRRYNVSGYMAFANFIKKLIAKLPTTLSQEERRRQESKIIRQHFDGKLLLIDEAHNLRDVEGDIFDKSEADAPGGKADADDEASGKVLTPYLRKVLQYAQGLKLVLMTATPMYNNHREIVFMMNLIMLNEKKAQYKESMIFEKSGKLKPKGEAAIGYFGSRYVSYMRGENPKTFPLRLFPDAPRRTMATYAARDPRRAEIPAGGGLYMDKLPIVSIPLKGECFNASLAFTKALTPGEGGISSMDLSLLVRAGNFVPPSRDAAAAVAAPTAGAGAGAGAGRRVRGGASSNEEEEEEEETGSSTEINDIENNSNTSSGTIDVSSSGSSSSESSSDEPEPTDEVGKYRKRMEEGGLKIHFERRSVGPEKQKELQFHLRSGSTARWLGEDQIGTYAPKFEFLLGRLKTCRGVAFVYSRFVESGAVPLALTLEANGYKPWGRRTSLLQAGIQTEGGGQCALCELRERDHRSAGGHPFTQAYYGLLTGDTRLSPDNQAVIRGEQDRENKDGTKLKVIIGSQIASEGVDLKYIRETHVLDSWFHLNKTEQIIGRSIRFCSHSLLPLNQRNVTVYLYASVFPSPYNKFETADEYSYRIAFQKARLVGAVTRTLKTHAIDCNLNHDAIVIRDQLPLEQEDSQGKMRRDVSINDMPYTAVCDWLETCDYECKPKITVDIAASDDSTYSEFAARWQESKLRKRLRQMFEAQVFFEAGTMMDLLGDIPGSARSELLSRTVGNKLFEVQHAGMSGYIIYRNGYFVFQPFVYSDVHIPLSVRSAKFPVRRDEFNPELFAERPTALLPAVKAAAAVGVEGAGAGAGAGAAATEEAEETEDAAAATAGTEDVKDVWEAIVGWVDRLIDTSREVPIPPSVFTYLGSYYGRDTESTKKVDDILTMIRWVQYGFIVSGRLKMRDERGGAGAGAGAGADATVREIRTDYKNGFRYVLLSYMWDNWFSSKSQTTLMLRRGTDVSEMLADSKFTMSDGRVIYRLFDGTTGSLVYIGQDGKGASKAEIVYIEGESGKKKDPIGSLVVDKTTTHDPYGFLTAKKGHIIFKTSGLPTKGKVMKGKECAIVSNMTPKREQLKLLGAELAKADLPDLQLRPEIYVGEREVSGATRACTLIEFAFRFLDRMNAKGLRWFYRSVQAKVIGHSG